MLPLSNNITLSARALTYLRRWQKTIDDEADYEKQIAKAKKTWGKSNKTFDEIKEKLRSMSNETKRCSYCEDSYADEIEHIYPKDIYPEHTFVWENYLYACGPCNGPKSNQFALINPDQTLFDIIRPKQIPDDFHFVRPKQLPIALIDSRKENPLEFIELDIVSTFRFVPIIEDNFDPIKHLRATYTINILRLNEREYLIDARKNAYFNYCARLKEYINQKQQGVNQDRLNVLIQGIKTESHFTVWEEMKRNHQFIPELNQLFLNAPEAMGWSMQSLQLG